jgi:hypothetical protein
MTKNVLASLLLLALPVIATAQPKKADTVIVELAKTSRLIFTMKDKSDLPTLKAYDYQALFNDILKKLDPSDSTVLSSSIPAADTIAMEESGEEEWPGHIDDDDNDDRENRKGYGKGKRHIRGRNNQGFFNFDLGMNNFLENGKFPDEANAAYTVRPWGSWYIGLNSIQKIRVRGKFFTELGLGVSWYNFKFQNDGLIVSKGDSQVEFTESAPDLDPVKSKLTVCYLNASLVPVLDFGSRPYKSRFWGSNDAFRIGFGPYVGYRIQSYAKQVYEVNGDKEKDRTRNNFYINNLRYGARFQMGYRGTDIFVNYDMNELFAENRGPKLNAFSFGVIF